MKSSEKRKANEESANNDIYTYTSGGSLYVKASCISKAAAPSRLGDQLRYKEVIKTIIDGNRFRTELKSYPQALGRVSFDVESKGNYKFKSTLESWNKCYPNQGDPLPTHTSHSKKFSSRKNKSMKLSFSNEEMNEVERLHKATFENINIEQVRSKLGEKVDKETEYIKERFRLPNDDLLDALHSKASEFYTKSPYESGKSMFARLQGQVLLSFGILVQEMIREELAIEKGKSITFDQVNELAPNMIDLLGDQVLEKPIPKCFRETFVPRLREETNGVKKNKRN
jgi:hypothetical protein